MQTYLNRSGASGVAAFEIEERAIVVRFADGGTYRYDWERPGRIHVARMQLLARAGRGLATYISRNVRTNFATRFD